MRSNGLILVTASLALTLSACGKKEEAPAAAASDASAAATEAAAAPKTLQTGEFTVTSADGKALGTTTINADGTYRDQPASGLAVAGIAKIVDGKTCFDPSGKEGPTCYTDSAPGPDGSFTATADDGTTVTVKPVVK
jgi:hypothetical protein